MPEIWVPYGQVETLLTIQAENLGAVVEAREDRRTEDLDRLTEKVKTSSRLLVCDTKPPTIEVLKDIVAAIGEGPLPRILAADTRKVESFISELKGRVSQAPRPEDAGGNEVALSPELGAEGSKTFLATAQPDPLFGLVDAKVAAALNWIGGSKRISAQSAKDFTPAPFEMTEAFAAAERMVATIPEASFVTLVPSQGRAGRVFSDAPFDTIRSGFFTATLPQARAIVVGAGGAGYDDSLSGALRAVWAAVGGVRRTGEILLIAECSEGLGSKALEMLVSGRLGGEGGRRKDRYVDGLEEVEYLDRLTADYNVMLLSGLPELYTKSKMKLGSARGSGEALGKLLNKLGRTSKLNVVTRAPECRISSA